nr:MAG TPA: hypothetical protein [Caudoviricetes sp.]
MCYNADVTASYTGKEGRCLLWNLLYPLSSLLRLV